MICFYQNAKIDKTSSRATTILCLHRVIVLYSVMSGVLLSYPRGIGIEAIRVNDSMDFEHHPLAQDFPAYKGSNPRGRGWCCSIINLIPDYVVNVIRSLMSRGW